MGLPLYRIAHNLEHEAHVASERAIASKSTAGAGSAEIVTASPGLQLVYDTAPVGLAFLSTDCRYLMINQHLTEICGISVSDHIGHSVRETVPQVADQVEQIVQTIVRSGMPITGIEVNGQRPDGSNTDRVWVTYWHPLKDRKGDVIGVNVAAEEVTERKRAEAERAAMHERLRALNETLAERVEAQAQERDRLWKLSQDLLVVTDTEGTVINVNPAWTATLGWEPDELIGRTGEWLVHSDDRDRSREALVKMLAGTSTPHFENRIRCKDGSYRWLSWVSMPDRSSVYAIARDVTDLKRAREQLNALRRELARVAQQTAIGAMAASIAHEIKQPLAAVTTSANAGLRWLGRAEPNLAEAQGALERVAKGTHQIDEVITSIRTMFGGRPSEKAAVHLRSLVDGVLALTQGELEANGILARNDVANELPAVLGDRVQLQQVLVNLIVNAIEALTVVNDRERQLTIGSDFDGQQVTVSVSDTGIGINFEQLDQIFEPLFTTKSSGMGLGLSICRSIVEAHGGRLWATARAPYGTTFHLTLFPSPID